MTNHPDTKEIQIKAMIRLLNQYITTLNVILARKPRIDVHIARRAGRLLDADQRLLLRRFRQPDAPTGGFLFAL